MSVAPFSHFPPAAFRAARDYLHSTDIYEEIMGAARARRLVPAGPFDLRLRGRITRRPTYHFRPRDDAPARETAASADLLIDGAPWAVDIVETAERITGRKAYDEQPVWEQTRRTGETFAFHSNSLLRPIETVAAIGVLLHKTLFPPSPGKRWMLVQLSLNRLLDERDSQEVAVTLDRRLGTSTTRSRIAGADGMLGTMMFILG